MMKLTLSEETLLFHLLLNHCRAVTYSCRIQPAGFMAAWPGGGKDKLANPQRGDWDCAGSGAASGGVGVTQPTGDISLLATSCKEDRTCWSSKAVEQPRVIGQGSTQSCRACACTAGGSLGSVIHSVSSMYLFILLPFPSCNLVPSPGEKII